MPPYNRYSPRDISIHAPLAGCDLLHQCSLLVTADFNPRTPCGVRHGKGDPVRNWKQFQSTHPLRGATLQLGVFDLDMIFQSTHPLRGATHGEIAAVLIGTISIHAPLAGCDSKIAEIFPANLRKSYKISAKPNKERRCRVLGKGKAAAISDLARCEPPGENRNASGSHQIMSAPSGA